MKNILMLLLAAICFHLCRAQDSTTLLSSAPAKIFDNVSKTQLQAAYKIDKQNNKLRKLMHAKEGRLYKQLYALGSKGILVQCNFEVRTSS